jgi:hypothetical protein
MVDINAATVDSAYVLTALSYVIILTRLSLRYLKHERFKVDDYLMGIAIIFYALHTAVYPIVVRGHIDEDKIDRCADFWIALQWQQC